MFQVKSDKPGNLLTLVFTQHVGADESKAGVATVKAALDELQPGFRLLTDLSGLDSMDAECATYIRKTMDLCNAKGIGRVVRVIPDPRKDIGLSIMSLFHYRRRVPIVTCETREEAENLLAD